MVKPHLPTKSIRQGLARRNTFVCRGMREEYTFYNRDEGLGLSQTDSGVPVFRRACAGSSAEDRARQDRDELQLRHGYSSTRGRSRPVTFCLAVSTATTSTVVIVVCRDLDQATASQRFQGGGQS